MIVKESGPFDLLYRFRNVVGAVEVEMPDGDVRLEAQNWFAAFFVCPLCLAVWLAIPFTLYLGGGLLEWLAVSGLARLLLVFSEK
jgi:hypothetical protein